jgi:predicted acyl esterase
MQITVLAAIIAAATLGDLSAAQGHGAATGVQIVQGTLKIYGNDAYPVPYRRAQPITAPRARYPGFKPSTTILKKGTVRREGGLVLPCDIVFERDVAVKLRDGITMYTDVFRPVGNETVPGIIAWGPYGKEVGGQHLDDVRRVGIPLSRLSDLQKFEAADPAYWVNKGYAILNPDSRGAYYSEGNITYWGRQLAEDGYDFVEWAAQQPWSNKKLAFSGNSFLAISQWFIAAENPPHLAAIAPWEGFYDMYREASRRGGIGQPGFGEEIVQTYAGRNFIEDQVRMQMDESQALMNPYWEDKAAKLEKINIPAYVVASYTSPIHTHGSFEGFRQINTTEKWLRVHNTGEWPDYYQPEYVEDLRKFFDRYLKGIQNGWEKTPRVRVSVLNPGGKDTVDRPETDWPVPGLQKKTLFLQDDKTLTDSSSPTAAKLSYVYKGDKSSVELQYKVPKTMELLGYSKVRLWVEADGSNDMELTVAIVKRDANNKEIPNVGFPIAAAGLLRVSHRELDVAKSTDFEPYLTHKREQLLKPGEIVPVDIALWPMGLRFNPGEKLVLSIAATYIPPVSANSNWGSSIVPVPADGGTFTPGSQVELLKLGGRNTSPAWVAQQGVQSPKGRNNGTHIIHFGGKYDSHVLLPIKY